MGHVITVDLANTIFIVCLAVGGVLLLITVLLDDILGGLLDPSTSASTSVA